MRKIWDLKAHCLIDFEDDGEDESDSGWQEELQRRYEQDATFMAELRARQANSPGNNPNESFSHISYQYQQHPISQHYGSQQNMFSAVQQNHSANGSQNYNAEEYGSYNRTNCNQRLFGQQPLKSKQYPQEHENGQNFSMMKEQNQDKIQFEEALKQWVNR